MDDGKFSQKSREEMAVERNLALAETLIQNEQAVLAEVILQRTLSSAIEFAGENSALTALVLIELLDLYERQHRAEDAAATWERIREIAITYKTEVQLRDSGREYFEHVAH